MSSDIISLLAAGAPRRAQDFMLAFGDQRSASWADSQQQAAAKAASQRHIPHFRGQLRHQLGEAALARAAAIANIGCIPIQTVKPGGVFMVARVGRFGLVSLSLSGRRSMPRRSQTRHLLSEPNDDIDPQKGLFLAEHASARGATELAYFGCMIACASWRDPSTPSEIAFAVPNARLTDWIDWMPLNRVYALLQDVVSNGEPDRKNTEAKPITDKRIPRFRLPKQDREASDDE